jgi:hypothetical protein
LRGLFERERSLLGLLSRTAYEAVRLSFQALWNRKDVRPGCVFSLQFFTRRERAQAHENGVTAGSAGVPPAFAAETAAFSSRFFRSKHSAPLALISTRIAMP